MGPGPSNPFNGGYQRAGSTFTVTGSGDIAPNVPGGPDGSGESPSRAITTGTFFALLVMVVPIVLVFLLRVKIEETALLAGLGEPYAAYPRRTKRLIPGVY